MILNAHSYYSLRYGMLSIDELTDIAIARGYDAIALTDINNSTGALEFVKVCRAKGIKPIVGMEFRNGDTLEFIALARNNKGFQEINELMTDCNLFSKEIPNAPSFENCYVIYPYGKMNGYKLKEHEYIGIKLSEVNKILVEKTSLQKKYVMLESSTFKNRQGYNIHKKLRAIHHNSLITQLKPSMIAGIDEYIVPKQKLLNYFQSYPHIIENTNRIINDCEFSFDFKVIKNKKLYTTSAYDDKQLLEKLAFDGLKKRYGAKNKEAISRVKKELEIIDNLGFSAYFLTTWDIIRYSMQQGYYHVGRGSGANSVVAYCLNITDVCPIELDLYFERFLNPKRQSPPDFDIDYSWKDRDDVTQYIFNRYGHKHTALLGAMNTFRDNSIIREMGKVQGLPKEDIDRLVHYPNSPLNDNAICKEILADYNSIQDFPNSRTIHAGGILISEEPITCYTALDLPPKGYLTTQFDMHIAEDIGFEKLDILSQRGIGHIKEAAEIIQCNRGIAVDVHKVDEFKKDEGIRKQLLSGDTIGCFYIESPAMRGLLKKLRCETYLMLVAASSIIRPGVAKSGMMKEFIYRSHNPDKFEYLHPVMEQQLRETFGVMVYQEDVLKVGHHFGGLDLADADVLRRMMSGKSRNKKHMEEIHGRFFEHCKKQNYPEHISLEVWRQMESFAGYSFNKAHSASYAVESYQSLFLKTYYPLEFMVAVINNFGGFYTTRVYVNEARKSGGNINLPCVNNSTYMTTLYDKEVYLGFVHIKSLEKEIGEQIQIERNRNGLYTSLENFKIRTNVSLEQLRILIRVGALRFTGLSKPELLFEAQMMFDTYKKKNTDVSMSMFSTERTKWRIPKTEINKIQDAYDEMEILEFPVTLNEFEMVKSKYKGDCNAKDLLKHLDRTIRIVGNFVTQKQLRTSKGEPMAFGTFLDSEGNFFDTTHFTKSLIEYGFKGFGVYLIMGRVVEEFGFPSITVDKMGKLDIKENQV